MAEKNVLIFIHGITPTSHPMTHQAEYDQLLKLMQEIDPTLKDRIDKKIFVEWGAQSPTSKPFLRPDERITKAQSAAYHAVSYANTKKIQHKNNKLIRDYSFLFPLRGIFTQIKMFFILGLADAMYYASPEGEEAIRKTVYGQVLDDLRGYEKDTVNLHVIGHSMGCTVAFDLLYGLFAPPSNWKNKKPDFASDKDHGKDFLLWRAKKEKHELKLGSHISMAGQLPVTLLRKQKVVDILAAGEKLDASLIGVNGPGIKWKIFYDIDDLLSYPARSLFSPNEAIMDIQVDTADLPHNAHVEYWKNKNVAKEIVDLLKINKGL